MASRRGATPSRLREWRAIAAQGRLILQGIRRVEPMVEGDRVVVFAHGFLAAGPVFDPMRTYVERETGLATVGFTYGPLSTFEGVVQRFAEHVRQVVPRGARVSLVGHSLGGIVARWYVQEMGGSEHVDRVVTLAAPHAGTRSALGMPGSLAATLRPGSSVLVRLAAGRSRVQVPHVAVVAGCDTTCLPPDSAAAIRDCHVHWFDDLGHNEMLFDRRVHDVVARALT